MDRGFLFSLAFFHIFFSLLSLFLSFFSFYCVFVWLFERVAAHKLKVEIVLFAPQQFQTGSTNITNEQENELKQTNNKIEIERKSSSSKERKKTAWKNGRNNCRLLSFCIWFIGILSQTDFPSALAILLLIASCKPSENGTQANLFMQCRNTVSFTKNTIIIICVSLFSIISIVLRLQQFLPFVSYIFLYLGQKENCKTTIIIMRIQI